MGRILKTETSKLIDWFCPICNERVSEEDEVCPNSECGAKFASVDTISEEEKKIQETREKIMETVTPAPKKEKAPPKRRMKKEEKEEEEVAEPKTAASYTPRPGTRLAFIWERLQGKGTSLDDLAKEFAKEFEIDQDAAMAKVKGAVVGNFKNYRKLPIVEEDGVWRLDA